MDSEESGMSEDQACQHQDERSVVQIFREIVSKPHRPTAMDIYNDIRSKIRKYCFGRVGIENLRIECVSGEEHLVLVFSSQDYNSSCTERRLDLSEGRPHPTRFDKFLEYLRTEKQEIWCDFGPNYNPERQVQRIGWGEPFGEGRVDHPNEPDTYITWKHYPTIWSRDGSFAPVRISIEHTPFIEDTD